MKMKKGSLLVLLLCIMISMAFGQSNESKFNKIIVSKDSLVYYSMTVDAVGKVFKDYKINTISEIHKKTKDNECLLVRDPQMRRVNWGDSEIDANFMIIDTNLIVLSIQRKGFFLANSEMDYWINPWMVYYKCLNTTNTEIGDIRFNFLSTPSVQLDNQNPKYSKKPIFYDFFQYKNDIFLMILADHTLYLYESASSLAENQWQLKKTFSDLKFQSFFRAYKDASYNLILDFGSDESYCLDIETDSISLIATNLHEDKCLVHNQLTDEFLWLTPTQAEELIASDEPAKYINQFKRE